MVTIFKILTILTMAFLGTSRACDDSGGPEINVKDNDLSLKTQTKTLHINNMCSFDLDLGFTGGFSGLAVDGQCGNHQVNDGTNRCFWNMDIQDYLGSGSSTSVKISEQEGEDAIISGAIYGFRTPFMEDACPDGKCKPYVGPSKALTRVEFTLLRSDNVDYYDVSVIEGANLGVTMGPTYLEPDPLDNYRNGVAGDGTWLFEPLAEYRKYLIEVKNARGMCSQDSECEPTQVCGTSISGVEPVHGTCGSFGAFINAHVNCIAGSTGYPFFCETHKSLYGCSDEYSQSGYSQIEGGSHICGCSDYEDMDLVSSFPCVNSNPVWVEKAYRWIHYMKKAVPTGYVYAYDDSTSTFTSKSDEYDITFCPGDSEENMSM